MTVKEFIDGARVLAGLGVAVTATGPAGAAMAVVTAAGGAEDLFRRLATKPELVERIAAGMARTADGQNLSGDHRALIAQMTEALDLGRIFGASPGRDPVALTRAMLDTLTQPDFRDPGLRDAFARTMQAVLAGLFADKDVLDELRPTFEAFVIASNQRQEQNDARTHEKLDDLMALVKTMVPAAREKGVPEQVVIEIARRIAPDVADADEAMREIARGIDLAAKVIGDGLRGSNLGALVDDVLRDLASLTAGARLTEAQDRANQALADAEAGEELAQERTNRLLEAGIEQDILARDALSAAAKIARRLDRLPLDSAPAGFFAALRKEQDDWYMRGRDKGLTFDLEVSVHLARDAVDRAADADEKGAALNDLGIALATLGEREGNPARLEEAVTAYGAALAEWTRDRVQLDWAMTKNNLGNALQTLGKWEGSAARLEEAVTAYRDALEERTRERVPLDWAGTQNNLGNALRTLGAREGSAARLEEAVTAYRDALEEWTRERAPLQWAGTQNNLGTALLTLGEWGGNTGRLDEAITAFRAALEEWTRERVPLDWAMTQNNLGNALAALGERERNPARLEEAVTAYRAALKERTRERVPLQWAMTQNNLGNALAALFERERNPARLEQAVTAYRTALEERRRDRVPLLWAGTQYNLALADLAFHTLQPDPARLRAARDKVVAAREVFAEGHAQMTAGCDRLLAEIDRLERP